MCTTRFYPNPNSNSGSVSRSGLDPIRNPKGQSFCMLTATILNLTGHHFEFDRTSVWIWQIDLHFILTGYPRFLVWQVSRSFNLTARNVQFDRFAAILILPGHHFDFDSLVAILHLPMLIAILVGFDRLAAISILTDRPAFITTGEQRDLQRSLELESARFKNTWRRSVEKR